MFLQCGLFNDTDRVLNMVKKSFLAEKVVHPMGKSLLLSSAEELYTRLAVHRTQAADGQTYTILYLLTGKHTIFLIYISLILSFVSVCPDFSLLPISVHEFFPQSLDFFIKWSCLLKVLISSRRFRFLSSHRLQKTSSCPTARF